MKVVYFFLLPLVMGLAGLNPPAEICDNALDDDGDGLFDLNDPDCECPLAQPLSLIPNPSFEEMECCPNDRSRLDCATGWIQASEATTDYLHTCGWMGWPDLPPPLPFPDGDGCVGFRNGREGGPNGNDPEPNWKEYAGACLLSPMKAGTVYRFEFWVGFTHAINSPPTTLVFFGTDDCGYLPFGVGDPGYGCPLNGFGWKTLGSVAINGANQWRQFEITVSPDEDISAIAIGPSCDLLNPYTSFYYFFDNLVLADVKEFEQKIAATGHPCSEDIDLSIPYRDTLAYQWYKDGVALVGETGPQLAGVQEAGSYQVRLIGPNSCRVAKAYNYVIPIIFHTEKVVICREETFFFNGTALAEGGVYYDTLQSYEGCDSVVTLELKIAAEEVDTVFAKIFETEGYRIGKQSYHDIGEYDAVLEAWNGCDSVVHLVLDHYKLYVPNAFSPNGDGINDVFRVFSGSDVKEVLSLRVFDRWGGLFYESSDLQPQGGDMGWDGFREGKPAVPGIYTYQATIVFEDGKARELFGDVLLVR